MMVDMKNHRNLKNRLLLLAGVVMLSSVFCARLTTMDNTPAPGPAATTPTAAGIIIRETQPAASKAENGSISGMLSYPSESIPPLRVVAFRVDGGAWYAVEVTAGNQFLIENLPAGDYYIVAYLIDKQVNQGGFAGGYSYFVPCGMSVDCSDHTLIPVEVASGCVTTGINPGDWYAPENTFPPDPAN
jgi:hypothetical protein